MFKSSVVSLLVPHICYIALHHTPHENINRCYKKVKSKVRANSVSVAHPSSANSEMPRIVNYFQRLWPCVKLWSVLSSLLYVFHLSIFSAAAVLDCFSAAVLTSCLYHLFIFFHFIIFTVVEWKWSRSQRPSGQAVVQTGHFPDPSRVEMNNLSLSPSNISFQMFQ